MNIQIFNKIDEVHPPPNADCLRHDTLQRMRRSIVQAASRAGEGHVPSALSILDILSVLYSKVMQHRALAGQSQTDRDRFVLSKGHGSLALYAVLAEHEEIVKLLIENAPRNIGIIKIF